MFCIQPGFVTLAPAGPVSYTGCRKKTGQQAGKYEQCLPGQAGKIFLKAVCPAALTWPACPFWIPACSIFSTGEVRHKIASMPPAILCIS